MVRFLLGFLGLSLVLVISPAHAEGPTQPSETTYHWMPGPKQVALGHELTVNVPAGDIYLGGDDAKHLLEKNGTLHNENLLGIVAGEDSSDWLVTFRYEEDGYVKDDETLDPDGILKSMREGTEEDNKERTSKGFDPLTINGWRELPRYERASHHLVWGLDVATPKHVSVNYSTRILGRKGWVALNLLSSPESLAANKPFVTALLASTTFDRGARYEDFVRGKDKVAEYGLAGLVLGGVGLAALKVAKVGVIAKFWNVIVAGLLVAKKAIFLGIAAVAAFLKKLFGRRNKAQVAPSGDPGTS